LAIVDPKVGESLRVTPWDGHEDAKPLKRSDTSSYLHGYVDFSVWPSDPENQNDGTTNGPTRKSLLDDIVYYWKHVSTEKQRSELKGQPATAALYMNKIIASNWVVMLEHLSATLSNLERRLWILDEMSERNTGPGMREFERSIDTTFRPLLACGNIWRRRLWWYLEDMRWNMEAMKAFLKQNPEFEGALDDFTTVKDRMEECRNRIDSLMQTVIGAGTLLVSQNSSNQAESASRISGLAIAFLPFSFASSLFAMIDPYSPGNAHFWIYWVVSIGLILIVITVIYGLKWWSQHSH
jgi:Mg2+ and Co2+ transporter CorA